MHDEQQIPPTDRSRLSALELADLAGDPVERIVELAAYGVIVPDQDGRYEPGDVHRIRVVDGFEAAGVPLDVLVEAQAAGLISVAFYDDLHSRPGHPSARTFDAFQASLGTRGRILPALFAAFGLAEPDGSSHLSREDEAFIAELVEQVEATGHADLALRLVRQFGEAARRASAASMEVYVDVIERLGPGFGRCPDPGDLRPAFPALGQARSCGAGARRTGSPAGTSRAPSTTTASGRRSKCWSTPGTCPSVPSRSLPPRSWT